MKIIVCLKQVPGSDQVKINPQTNTLMRENVPGIINPLDTYGLEEGVRLKEKFGGDVTVVSMGPPQVENSLRDALSLGADETVLLSDRAFAGSDTWATSYTLSKGIEKIGSFDLIICGKQSIDGETSHVGPQLAEFLNVPTATCVRKVVSVENGKITVERMMDDGYDVVEMPLPALITVVKGINTPRMPSLKGKMRAKNAVIKTLNAEALEADKEKCGANGSPTIVSEFFAPHERTGGEILSGDTNEVVGRLVDNLKKAGIV